MEKIPTNLKDTVEYIDNLMISSMEQILKNYTEHDFVIDSHFGLGVYLRNHFKLWEEKSTLRNWFYDNYFLEHPDDITSLILTYYYRIKNNKNSDISDAVNNIYKYWLDCDSNFYKKLRKFKLNKINGSRF